MALVSLVQYLRPDGRRQDVQCEIPDEVAAKASGMVLSCEVLIGGQVAIYGRYADEDEDEEELRMASNGPGKTEPPEAVAKVIEAVWKRRQNAEPGADTEGVN